MLGLPPLDPVLGSFIAAAPQGLAPSWEELSRRFEQLRQKADVLEERVLTAGGAARLVQEFCERADERANAHGVRLDERLQAVEGRVELLERSGDDENAGQLSARASVAAEWQEEVLRLRSEVTAGVQEINEELGRRLRKLECWQDDLEADLRQSASEALETCSRLADDSLAASEATQVKLLDLRERLEADLQGLRQEVAERLGAGAAAAAGRSQDATDKAILQVADELGGQIYRLGGALRRIVQVQRDQQRHLSLQQMGQEACPEESRYSPVGARREATLLQPDEIRPQAGSDASQRHETILALYEELRRLEEGLPSAPGACCRQSAVSTRASPRLRRRRGCQPERRCSRERRCCSGRQRCGSQGYFSAA